MHWNGISTNGFTMPHMSGNAMFNAQLKQQSAVFGIAQHSLIKS